jgi:hypothetical protein
MRAVISVILLAFSMTCVLAGETKLNLKLDLENNLQQKLRPLVTLADPDAQVVVNVELKKISTELPGANLGVKDYLLTSAPDNISTDDIQSIRITVISEANPFPENIKALINRALQIPGVVPQIAFETADLSARNVIQAARKPASGISSSSPELTGFIVSDIKRSLTLAATLVLILGFVLAGLLFMVHRSILSGITALVGAIGSASEDTTRGTHEQLKPVNTDLPTIESNSEVDQAQLQSLKTAGLVALLSDCYWCEEDGYASWLWKKIPGDQKRQIISEWNPAEAYVLTLGGSSIPKEYHQHPHYLNPSALHSVSQEDLLRWVKINTAAWPLLSPIRQHNLKLSLLERTRMLEGAAKRDLNLPLPSPSITVRTLHPVLDIRELSEDDEMALFENPEMIPNGIKHRVQSLAWVCLLEKPERDRILQKMSAQQIAQAWVGPEVLLAIMAQSVGEKRLRLVESYKHQASRDSLSMRYLVEQALDFRFKQGRNRAL